MVQKTFQDSTEKFCPHCELTKPVTEFYASNGTIHGFDTYCKACRAVQARAWRLANKPKAAADQKRWRQKNARAAKDYHLQLRYGLPPGGYDKMLAEQDGKCACCGSQKPGGRGDFHVDHCHDTGKIRGLLCHGCNVSIGHFDHDPHLLEKAVAYLNRTSR